MYTVNIDGTVTFVKSVKEAAEVAKSYADYAADLKSNNSN